jgi:hypothetical protein
LTVTIYFKASTELETKLSKSEARTRRIDRDTLMAVKDEDEVIDHPVIEAFIRMAHSNIFW